jgi:hypothetical protein
VKRIATLLLLFLGASVPLLAQSAPQTQTWSISTSAVTLPGGNQTFVGVDSGIAFTPTPNLDVFDRNVVATGPGFGFYGGGFNYRFPAFSTMLNNQSPNVNFLRFQIGVTGSFGVDRIQLASAPATQHYAWTAGLFANYQISSGGAWQLGVKAEYVQFPGVPGQHVMISLNPSFHF